MEINHLAPTNHGPKTGLITVINLRMPKNHTAGTTVHLTNLTEAQVMTKAVLKYCMIGMAEKFAPILDRGNASLVEIAVNHTHLHDVNLKNHLDN